MKLTRVVIGIAVFCALPCRFAQCAEGPHAFAKYAKEITAFEKSDRAAPPPRGALLFTGSSTIRRWTTLAQDFPQH